MSDLYEFSKRLGVTSERNIVFMCFNGQLSHPLIEELARSLSKKLEYEKIEKSTIYNIFSVFVEQVINIKRYYEKRKKNFIKDHLKTSGTILIEEKDERFIISTGNIILNVDVSEVENNLRKIAFMNKEELKVFYKSELKKSAMEEDTLDAGLGFIEISRRASEPVKYSFDQIDDMYTFFTMEVLI